MFSSHTNNNKDISVKDSKKTTKTKETLHVALQLLESMKGGRRTPPHGSKR